MSGLNRALLFTLVFAGAGVWTAVAAATAARVEGRVTDASSGAPVPAAVVRIPALGLSAVSAADGTFAFDGIGLASQDLRTTITVSAEGYGDWTLQDVRLIAGDTLVLEVALGSSPTLIVVPPPRAEAPAAFAAQSLGDLRIQGAGPSQLDLPLPATIRVRVTGYPYCDTARPYTVQTVDFKEYAKHVLPNEWVATWPWESIRAGAMAVKMYAWSYIAVGGKWPDADVYDSTCDQVYNPAYSYASTDQAVEDTWNWRLSRGAGLLRTFYRAFYSQCEAVQLQGNCMGQVESREMAYDAMTWDEILFAFYDDAALSPIWNPPGGFSLRFRGNGYGDLDRVKIPIDPPVPADIGEGDFTLEWWMKVLPGENGSPACAPGGNNWFYGNTIFDRDVYGPGDLGDYGVSLAAGRIAFGVGRGAEAQTLCGATDLQDGAWHHVAVTRSTSGEMRIYVDGRLDGSMNGPAGDLRYRDGRPTSYPNDPYLVIGAEKNDLDSSLYPSFSGWLDEIRLSTTLRYLADFSPPESSFTTDPGTAALYHFDEGFGNVIGDSSGAPGGPSHGLRKYGGVINGPEWTLDTVWFVPPPTPTPTATPTPTVTSTASPTLTSTPGPSPTATPTSSPTLTATPGLSPTGSVSPTATTTPSPAPSSTPAPSATVTPSSTSSPTASPSPSATSSQTAVPTATFTATSPATPTASPTTAPTPTTSPSSTPTPTTAPTQTVTPSATAAQADATATPSPTPRPADLNGDGQVNVLDVQLSVNVFLGLQTDPAIVARADVNGDGAVNVLDVQAIANIVLSG
jgi:hypothetical protein